MLKHCLIASLLVWRVCAAQAQPAQLGPRLLAAEKDGRVSFFLPESHLGTPAQDDRYFETIIKPAFSASSVLLIEQAPDPRLDADYHQRECAEPDVQDVQLDRALDAAIANHPASALERMVPLSALKPQLGRFIRFLLLMRASTARDNADPSVSGMPQPAVIRGQAPQSTRLMAESKHPFESVDNTASLFRAYCAVPPLQRLALIQSYLNDLDAVEAVMDPGKARDLARVYQAVGKHYGELIRRIRAVVKGSAPAERDGQALLPSAESMAKSEFLITERNRGWVAQLPAVLAREHLPFYALGAAHFVDGPHRTGLISLLRDAGYRISVISDPQALRRVLSRAPASQPVREAERADLTVLERPLQGKCLRMRASYVCSWGDASTLYTASPPSPGAQTEILTVCYERAGVYGANRTCVTTQVPRPAHRDADVAAAAAPGASAPPEPS